MANFKNGIEFMTMLSTTILLIPIKLHNTLVLSSVAQPPILTLEEEEPDDRPPSQARKSKFLPLFSVDSE